jgi:endonuclease/exonuclease/phosphatase family metal-dependent hydrolase
MVLVGFWLLLGAFPAQAVVAGTFNLRYDNQKDVEKGNGWAQRAPVIAALIRFHRFDVLGTQEALQNQLDDLQQLLPGYAWSGCGRDDGQDAGEHAAIFYKKDVFTRLDGGTFWLSPTPSTPSIGWDAKLKRICTWVKLEYTATHKPLFVFNTHFDHQGVVARAESARMIVKAIKTIAGGQPAILTGDFNVDQTSASYKVLHDCGILADSFETAAERYALDGTPNGFNVNSQTDSRIDHVFHTSGFKVLRYGVLTDSYRTGVAETTESGSPAFPGEVKFKNYQARTPSDHFPVLVEFE